MRAGDINEAKKAPGHTRPPPCCTAARPRTRRPAAAEGHFEEGRLSATCRRSRSPAPALEAGVQLAATWSPTRGLAASRGEARALAQGGGLRLNDEAEADANRAGHPRRPRPERRDRSSAAGKKKLVLVKPV